MPAVDILCEDLGLPAVPFPLDVPGHGDTKRERASLRAAVYAELAGRGLADRDGAAPVLAEALRLLTGAKVTIDLIGVDLAGRRPPQRAVVAALGRRAILAMQGEPGVRLAEVPGSEAIGSIVRLLPPSRPGPGRPIALPAAALTRDGSPTPSGRHSRSMPDDDAELAMVQQTMGRPVQRAGQLGGGIRDARGALRRLAGIGWFDTDQGRYATSLLPGEDGEQWTTLAPADNAVLVRQLSEMLSSELGA